jgi:hypothetical protein
MSGERSAAATAAHTQPVAPSVVVRVDSYWAAERLCGESHVRMAVVAHRRRTRQL